MDVYQGKEKIREIIRRSSIRNYFTPMLPKHSEKPKLSKSDLEENNFQEPRASNEQENQDQAAGLH